MGASLSSARVVTHRRERYLRLTAWAAPTRRWRPPGHELRHVFQPESPQDHARPEQLANALIGHDAPGSARRAGYCMSAGSAWRPRPSGACLKFECGADELSVVAGPRSVREQDRVLEADPGVMTPPEGVLDQGPGPVVHAVRQARARGPGGIQGVVQLLRQLNRLALEEVWLARVKFDADPLCPREQARAQQPVHLHRSPQADVDADSGIQHGEHDVLEAALGQVDGRAVDAFPLA